MRHKLEICTESKRVEVSTHTPENVFKHAKTFKYSQLKEAFKYLQEIAILDIVLTNSKKRK
jgi:hypothetical protein